MPSSAAPPPPAAPPAAPQALAPVVAPSSSPRPQLATRQMNGQIQLILGPMFSGKSSELLRRVRRFGFAKKTCLLCKYDKDQRYGSAEQLSTHDKVMHTATPCARLSAVQSTYRNFDVIAIDEGQFFPDLNEFCEMAANDGKIVIVAALDGTFERKPFGRILDLISKAERVDKINAVCPLTGRDAAFTRRFGNETAIEVIGAAEMYTASCRSSFHMANPDSPTNSSEVAKPSSMEEPPASETIECWLEGQVQAILGPMFSGKSTELHRRLQRYVHGHKRVLCIKRSDASSGEDTLIVGSDPRACNDLDTLVVCSTAGTGSLLALLETHGSVFSNYHVIGIDEGQFFDDLVVFCDTLANKGKIVIVAALDGDYDRKPLGRSCDLVASAERVDKLTAVCALPNCPHADRCASFTRLATPGGSNKYMPACRSCHALSIANCLASTGISTPPAMASRMITPSKPQKAKGVASPSPLALEKSVGSVTDDQGTPTSVLDIDAVAHTPLSSFYKDGTAKSMNFEDGQTRTETIITFSEGKVVR